MKDSTIVMIVAEIFLGATAIIVPDPTIRAVSVGAMAGIVGGHFNGAQGTAPASQ